MAVMPEQEGVRECLPALPESVTRLRRTVVAFADARGASQRQLEDIAVGVSEAVTNVVRHAYPEGEPGFVDVDGSIQADRLVVLVADEGVGRRPGPESRGALVGLSIIAAVTTSFSIGHREPPPGMRCRMCFAVG